MKLQDPITANVAAAIGMTAEECESNPKRAARKAAACLRANGYSKRYCHIAWQRGMRWYYQESDVPEPDYCSTSLLGVALIEGRIESK
jgi:hypothetical protein